MKTINKSMQRKFWEHNLNGITGMPSITSIKPSLTVETFARPVAQNLNGFKNMQT